jgi:hypothetical protein
MFHASEDVNDIVLVEELFERMMAEIPVPS